ncbi:hypothetical protein [Flavobacterium sp. KMS]|uniref:hypothetical protein n=1 Tax=Flavobacterium sp. KMS TaxID=1566023 RepID=UPI00068B0AEF|nr:hypothetical protein [Flavobacterium sp. KMS]
MKTSEALEPKIIDSLILLKDTIVFSNSSEGEKLSLFKNQRTNDSIIKSTIYGETGKIDYTFIFNKELFNANRVTSNYEEPIYINSNPKINKITDENLKTSLLTKEELTNIFMEDIKFFRSQKLHTSKSSNLKADCSQIIIDLIKGSNFKNPFKDNLKIAIKNNNEVNMKLRLFDANDKSESTIGWIVFDAENMRLLDITNDIKNPIKLTFEHKLWNKIIECFFDNDSSYYFD